MPPPPPRAPRPLPPPLQESQSVESVPSEEPSSEPPEPLAEPMNEAVSDADDVRQPSMPTIEDQHPTVKIFLDYDNSRCSCAKVGMPASGDAGFIDHSMFCQRYGCYAYEVGCCDPDIRRHAPDHKYEEACNLPCYCLEPAFPWPYCPASRRERFRPSVVVHPDMLLSEWRVLDPDHVGQRLGLCVHWALRASRGCMCNGAPGTWVPTCPFNVDASGRRRGDIVAQKRGHALWMDRARFGSPSLPSLPVSPETERFRKG